jgi:heterodisulfide reductase subunit A
MPESRDDSSPRIGVYICHCGGNISDVVDVKRVAAEASTLPGVVVARDYVFMCSDTGQGLIVQDASEQGLNRVVVAACSPSLHELTFRRTLVRAGLNPYLFEPANVREQISWSHKSHPEGATDKAIRMVAAAVAKVRLAEPLETTRVPATRHAVIIGGGVSGLRCALDLADKDIGVTLVERSPFLGGRTAQLHKVYPSEEEARELVRDLAERVLADDRISVYTCAEVVSVAGYIGDFHLRIRQQPRGVTPGFAAVQEAIAACPEEVENEFDYGLTKRKAIYLPYAGCFPPTAAIDWQTCTKCGRCREAAGVGIVLDEEQAEFEIRAGALILATGFDHYEPQRGEFAYGDFPEVITLPQLIRLLDYDGPSKGALECNGRPVRNVAFIHCVGSRQTEGVREPGDNGKLNTHCSRVCCTATLQAANEIKNRFPDVQVYDFYQDIRTYGKGHEEYYEAASRNGVLFLRYAPEEPPVVERGDNGTPLVVRAKDLLTFGEEVEVPADLVVLSVGMMPRDTTSLVEMTKVAVGADGFLLEVHPKLRPVETVIEGITLAGAAQAPMDITEACASASASASKVAVLLARDHVELPPYVAHVDESRCDGNALCVQECEYASAIEMVEKTINGRVVRQARVNPVSCKGCGACVAVCPTQAIQVKGWTVPQFEAMVSALLGGGGTEAS